MKFPRQFYSSTALFIISLMMVFIPFARGGVHLWMQVLIVIGVLLGWGVLCVERLHTGHLRFQKTNLFIPLCALIGWILFSALCSPLKPNAFEGVVLAVAYIGFYYLVVHSVRTRIHQRYLVYLLISIAFVLAVIGLLEFYGVTFSWWQYDDIRQSEFITSTYGNHNHFAGYLEMVIPLLLVLFMTRKRDLPALLILGALLFVICLAHLLSLSRGVDSTYRVFLFHGYLSAADAAI